MIHSWRVVLAAAALVGCYRTTHEAACAVRCAAADSACPSGLACGADLFCHTAGQPDCEDAPPPPPPMDAPTCFGTGLTEFGPFCLDPSAVVPPSFSIPLIGLTTDDTAVCSLWSQRDSHATAVCILFAHEVDLVESYAFTGSKPLVIIAIDRLTIESNASFHVESAQVPGSIGPGANDPSCDPATRDGIGDVSGGGGGAGGGFGGTGGAGGTGDHHLAGGAQLQSSTSLPAFLRGGCPGGAGGASPVTTAANGGAGGGAVYLIAGTSIEIDGVINASGAGANAAMAEQGGGGGGTGGMIALEAPAVTIGGTMFANGGGGGGGGSTTAGASPGGDPSASALMQLSGAAGGSAASDPSDFPGQGGAGSPPAASTHPPNGVAGASSIDSGGEPGTGGGGGGGGGGFIAVFGALTIGPAGVISPAPSTPP